MLKKLMFIPLLASLNGEAMAGSGAGGQIRFFNDSNIPVSVTFSGAGCAGGYYGLTLVCDTEVVQPGKNAEYKYNWGVTKTWINVQAPSGDTTWKTWAPCSSSGSSRLCFLDHKTISTNAWVWSEFRYKGENIPDDYYVNSNLLDVESKLLDVYKKYYLKAVAIDKKLPGDASAFILSTSKSRDSEWFNGRLPAGFTYDYKIDGEKSIPGKLHVKSEKLSLVSNSTNSLENNTPINQTLTTSAFSEQRTQTTTTTTTNGFTAGTSFSTAAKGKADFMFAAAEVTNTITVSMGYNFSTAVAETLTTTKTFNIPAQNIIVFPGCKAKVDGALKVGNISGDFTIKAPFVNEPLMNQGLWLPPTYEKSIWSNANMSKMMKLIKDSGQLESEVFGFDDSGKLCMLLTGSFTTDAAFEWVMSVTYEDITPGSCKVNPYASILKSSSGNIIDSPTMKLQSASQGINKYTYVYHIKPEARQVKNINGALGIIPWSK